MGGIAGGIGGTTAGRGQRARRPRSRLAPAGAPAAALLAALAFGGCTSVTTEQEAAVAGLPRPDMIVVEDFAVSPDEVTVDHGVGPAIREALAGAPRTDDERAVGRQVADALAGKLVAEIQDLGLPAERSGAALPAGKVVLVRGQFLAVDEGNRAERVIIGFGAGRSDVRVNVQLVGDGPDHPETLAALEVDAKSGLKPGMAETMGVGAAAGNLAVSAVASTGLAITSETLSADVAADAERAAKGIAKHLAAFFAKEGWITGE